MPGLLTKTVLWALAAYVAYCGALFLVQRHLLYPGTGARPPDGLRLPTPIAEKLWLETPQARTEAWLLPAAPGSPRPAPAVIFAHGNAFLIDHCGPGIAVMQRAGIDVLLVEYPGYGRSDGSPSQQSIAATMDAAYDRLAARPETDRHRIVLFGHSLGGGVVCDLSRRRPAAALVLLSTFTSVRPLASRYLAPGFLVRDPFDNLAALAGYDGPVLVAHGTADRLIPYDHALQLHAAARRSELVTFATGHGDSPPDWDVFTADMVDFLRRHDILPPTGG